MKIKFNLDDVLPLNKAIEISSLIILVTAIFHEDECLYKLWIIYKWYILIELMFLRILM